MNINDETFSAFLDGELPEPEMQQVRARLAEDPALADRLAELSAADETLNRHYRAIDQRPLPQGVQELLNANDSAPSSGRVIAFPLWRRARQTLSQHAGLAASIAFALGFGLTQVTGNFINNPEDPWQPIAQSLETLPSGTSQTLPDGRQITPRISFLNQAGQYCRQYRLAGAEQSTENIACRTDQTALGWEELASIRQPSAKPGLYQTASGGSLLDSTLDQMMAGDVIEPSREQRLIQHNWQNDQQQ